MPKIGIYYFVEGEILIDAVPVEQGEPYGTSVQHGSHLIFWNNFVPKKEIERKFKKKTHDTYPRGRVVYFQTTETFCFYQDKCLSEGDRDLIWRKFELEQAEIRFDERYQCAQCNQNFSDIV